MSQYVAEHRYPSLPDLTQGFMSCLLNDLPHFRTMMVSPVGVGLFDHQVYGAGRRSQGNDFGAEQHWKYLRVMRNLRYKKCRF